MTTPTPKPAPKETAPTTATETKQPVKRPNFGGTLTLSGIKKPTK